MSTRKNREKKRAQDSMSCTSAIGLSLTPPAPLAVTGFTVSSETYNKHTKGSETSAATPPPDNAIAKAFASIATNAWRLKNKIVDPGTGEPREEMKKLYRHVEAITDALSQTGVKTMEPSGRYDTGLPLKVLCYEETPGLLKEKIKETIKPTVAWHDRLIQIGEVIVGTPEKSDSEKGNQ